MSARDVKLRDRWAREETECHRTHCCHSRKSHPGQRSAATRSLSPLHRTRPRNRLGHSIKTFPILFSLGLLAPSTAMAQNCIPLTGSTECSAFADASISTNTNLTNLLYASRAPQSRSSQLTPFLQPLSFAGQQRREFRQRIARVHRWTIHPATVGNAHLTLEPVC